MPGVKRTGNENTPNFYVNPNISKRGAKKIDTVPIGNPAANRVSAKSTDLGLGIIDYTNVGNTDAIGPMLGVHFTRNTAVTDELRLNIDFTKEILSLYPKTGFASQALASFTPEEHKQYLEIMMGLSPFMQNLDKLSS